MGQSAKISDHLVQEIDELICHPEELGPHAIVFDIKIDEQHYGPIEADQLKEFFLIHDDLLERTQVKRTDEELYVPYFEHPNFQRRRPQLVSQQSLDKANPEYLWVLKNGQKNGPYTQKQLFEQVESAEVLRTDLISLDEGHTWQRLYELDEFDRRKLQAGQLPATPEGQVFVNSLREIRIQLANSTHQKEEADALTGLAYIGNLRNGKGVEGHKRAPRPLGAQVDQVEQTLEMPSPSSEPQWFWYSLFAASLMGIIALLLTWQKPDKTPAPPQTQQNSRTNTQTQKEVQVDPASVPTPTQNRSPQQTNQRAQEVEREAIDTFEPRGRTRNQNQQNQRERPRSREATSFRESRAYREAQEPVRDRGQAREREMRDDPYADDYYYDEGDVPPEQDPVRSRLSRETTDPRNSWADDLESIEEDPEYYEPGYVEPGVYPEEDLYEEY